eukprot:TRINITY_DN40537_c0_g1_i1.p1 TRINITY_DN40537_c0_g1~~TRINITY_DN40537_c0_g1_i1.p1  ORF type:complete len:235 (-),score=10.89 TRINITY_DN40537_c0_g1_i1:102-806(-)
MRASVGHRLPQFTSEERSMLRGSADYFALNHSTSRYGRTPNSSRCERPLTLDSVHAHGSPNWDEDQCCDALESDMDGQSIGPRPDGNDWLYAVPWGLRRLLRWLNMRYRSAVVVTENGCMDATGADLLADDFRIEYHKSYLGAIRAAISHDQVDVRGYFVWSLLDNVEWGDGFSTTFGLFHVDTSARVGGGRPSLNRSAKASAGWLTEYIRDWELLKIEGGRNETNKLEMVMYT